METRKYPIPDEIKELTTDALAELADLYELKAAGLGFLNCQEGGRRGVELLERANQFRKASDYFLSL